MTAPTRRPLERANPRGPTSLARAHPVATDAALAAVVLVASLVGLPPTPPDSGGPVLGALRAIDVLVLVLAGALLVVRRRRPLLVWAGCTALVLGVLPALGTTGRGLPIVAVALYTVAAQTDRRKAIASAVVTAVAGFLLVTVEFGVGPTDPLTYAAVTWTFLAAAIGDAVRSNRQVVASAVERAERAEATREEEARRRVAEERLRIGRELHDVVAHHVAAINVHAGVAEHLLRDDPEEAATSLRHVRQASTRALGEMHSLVGVLREPTDDRAQPTDPAPGPADLDRLVATVRAAGADVTWSRSGTLPRLPELTGLHLYRIVQEALTNAARHGTGPVELSTDATAEVVRVSVRNPTVSFRHNGSGGHGLVGMAERAALVGARLTSGPEPDGRHWAVRLDLPVRGSGGQAG